METPPRLKSEQNGVQIIQLLLKCFIAWTEKGLNNRPIVHQPGTYHSAGRNVHLTRQLGASFQTCTTLSLAANWNGTAPCYRLNILLNMKDALLFICVCNWITLTHLLLSTYFNCHIFGLYVICSASSLVTFFAVLTLTMEQVNIPSVALYLFHVLGESWFTFNRRRSGISTQQMQVVKLFVCFVVYLVTS